MKQIALTIEQMQNLQELGVDTSKATMKFVSMYPNRDYFEECTDFIPVSRNFYAKHYNEAGPTFTLQDILELLPECINEEYQLQIIYPCIVYRHFNAELEDLIYKNTINVMQNAYDILCWVSENGYLTNKEE